MYTEASCSILYEAACHGCRHAHTVHAGGLCSGKLLLLVLLLMHCIADVLCVMAACNASASPDNGDKGSCDSSLASGSVCQPTCNSGYTVSGVSSCNAGTLTAASCAPNRECHVAMGLNCVNH